MQQHIEPLENQLRISLQRNTHFEETLASNTSSLDEARVPAGKESLEKDVNDQLNSNHRLNARIAELESQVTKLAKAKPESDAAVASAAAALGQLQREHEILIEANADLKHEIDDQNLKVAVAQSENAQLHHEMKSELADRDFAFANAQKTIAGLEKEVE